MALTSMGIREMALQILPSRRPHVVNHPEERCFPIVRGEKSGKDIWGKLMM